jgi:hypothetical protein
MSRRKSNPEENGVAVDSPPVPAADGVDAPQPEEEKVQPIHAIRLKNVRAAIWVNRTEAGATYMNVTFSRSYRDQEGNWHTTESFGRDDLLLLAKVADVAHSWIWEQIQQSGGEVPF